MKNIFKLLWSIISLVIIFTCAYYSLINLNKGNIDLATHYLLLCMLPIICSHLSDINNKLKDK